MDGRAVNLGTPPPPPSEYPANAVELIDGWLERKAFETAVFYNKGVYFQCKRSYDNIQ